MLEWKQEEDLGDYCNSPVKRWQCLELRYVPARPFCSQTYFSPFASFAGWSLHSAFSRLFVSWLLAGYRHCLEMGVGAGIRGSQVISTHPPSHPSSISASGSISGRNGMAPDPVIQYHLWSSFLWVIVTLFLFILPAWTWQQLPKVVNLWVASPYYLASHFLHHLCNQFSALNPLCSK